MRFSKTIAVVAVTGATLVGCAEQPQYQGSSPTVRSLKDQAGMRDYYVGLDYKWALDRPSNNAITPSPEPIIQTPSPSAAEAAQGLRDAAASAN